MTCQICGASLPERAMFCGECGSSTSATPLSRKRADAQPGDTSIIAPLPPQSAVFSIPYRMGEEEPPPTAVVVPAVSPAAPPAAAPPAAAAPNDVAQWPPADVAPPFVMEFSTGESLAVVGSGLVGRRPVAQSDEEFDHLIQIHDVGMSVSKCHLEFGQHDGEFWITDRFSGNGTVIRRPDDSAIRCEPGRRYLVPRGSRVEIADQFFVLV
ncbi:FHA domain-containing protein [Glaciibacter psychrotolerans]|uniref:FHA domain-containing protein n=1 Tax=Glaciibacter psychrotolerans TaxID=670054 RepID=A0A7Z0EEJ8_9MICO|nr:FHA domain-containing protein [Leifsonia psychrotolerans]NYJ20053.1 hypothetical protein [Leifsonia psychrotolerans]